MKCCPFIFDKKKKNDSAMFLSTFKFFTHEWMDH